MPQSTAGKVPQHARATCPLFSLTSTGYCSYANTQALSHNREGMRPHHDQALAMAAVSGRYDGHSSFRHNNDDDDTCSQAVDELIRMFTPRLTPASRQRSHRLLGRIVKVVSGDDGEAAALEDGTALVHMGAL